MEILDLLANILTHVSQLLLSEGKFLLGVEDEVRGLANELEHMNNFLKNSEGKRDQHDNVVILVDQIRRTARDAEDIIDRHVVNVAKYRRQNLLEQFFNGFNKATMLHNVGEQIKQVRRTMKEIYDNYEKYQIPQKEGFINEAEVEELQKPHLLHKRRMEVEEDDVVGLVQEAEKLVNQLVDGNKELDVISISGMGGLGKTTLARKVYKHEKVKERFRCRAWVSVSQTFKIKELLLAILKEIMLLMRKEISDMNVEQLKQELKRQLANHRYLVVLDDIWTKQDWNELKDVFPNDKNGSRIFLTTRIKEVAFQASKKNPPLELRFLNPDESLELLTKKVFQGERCHPDFEPHGIKITAKCGGLPLAIVVLGGLLASREKTEHIWRNMIGKVNWHIAEDLECLDILGLSFRDLPPRLQPCFLYLGVFPEDYKIPARQLIQLWISEGFIQHEDNEKLKKEDVAEDYLHQLIDRSLIQVEERRSDGGIKTCRLHDLTRDLCLKLSKNERFLESHSSVVAPKSNPRRLSIQCSRRDYILNADSSNTCYVRTLLCFTQDSHKLSEKHWESLFQSFEVLRVLDLGDGEVNSLPKAIDRLIFLKYLKVRTVDIAGIPSTICALDQLQTLDLRWSRINVLPEGIWNMQQLRHLYLDGHCRLPKNVGKRCLSNLLTLCYISKDPNGRVHIAENAPNLRKLGLYRYRCNSSDDPASTFNLPYLETLKFANECTFKKLIELPPSVTKITIKKAHLKPETIQMFQSLSKLRILKLDEANFDDDELVFGKGWFPELQVLKIKNSKIVRWKLEQGAVPKLKRVVVSKCPGLTTPPEELRYIPTLQELKLSWLPESFTEKIGEFGKSELKVLIYSPVP